VTELSEPVNPALRLQKRQSGTRSLPLHYHSHTSAYFIISNMLLAKQEPFYIELLGFWTWHIIYRSDTQSFGACSTIEILAILLWHSIEQRNETHNNGAVLNNVTYCTKHRTNVKQNHTCALHLPMLWSHTRLRQPGCKQGAHTYRCCKIVVTHYTDPEQFNTST